VRSEAVLEWGGPRLRDLPWRRTRDPWAVLVSEVMLQQTQAPRVIPKWLAFMNAYPTPQACAAVPLADVLRLWQGLGYPRRARNLHLTAQRVAEMGRFPDQLDALLALPGIGQYTARAVLAFAFEADEAVVDTNIARVYARFAGKRLTSREVQQAADAALPHGDSWRWNQCLMDLGAMLCRPANPGCGSCPLHGDCAWGGEGPDPADGSAGVSRTQARFDGSDRQARGRLMAALGRGPLPVAEAGKVMGRSPAQAALLVAGLVADGLCERRGSQLLLPEGGR
jgi:A/G-specific adenine glycosylase